MVLIFIVFLFFIMTFASCSSADKEESRVPVESLAYDSITIAITYPLQPEYVQYAAYVDGEKAYMVGYNHKSHSLDFISLSGTPCFYIELQREGADGVLPPTSFCVTNRQVVWLNSAGITVLDFQGKVLRRIALSELREALGGAEYSFKPGGVTSGGFSYLTASGGRVYIPLFSASPEANAVGCLYSPEDGTVSLLPLAYPHEMVANKDLLGGLALPYIQPIGEKLIYNFPASSLIHVYEQGATKSFVLSGSDILEQPDAAALKNLSPRKKFEYESSAARCREVYYSPSRQKYFRLHYGTKTHFIDKNRPVYLMTCDTVGGNVKEYLLPPSVSGHYVVIRDTLYLACSPTVTDDEFKVIKVEL